MSANFSTLVAVGVVLLLIAMYVRQISREQRKTGDSKSATFVGLLFGFAPFFMIFICLPLLIGVRMLLAWLAPGLPTGPEWLDLAVMFVVPLTVVTLLLRYSELWPWKFRRVCLTLRRVT